jgi:hypothetical protein
MTNTSPDVSSAEARSALLREVTRAGFVPPPEAPLAEESRLRVEVDDFAASFFATPAGARRQRWQALSAECASSPPLGARLAALQPGLGLDLRLEDIGNPRTAQLASHVAGLFVLAPAARAPQRQAVLRGMQADIAGWEETARQFQAVAPALAALEPTLPAAILGWRQQQQRLARLREARRPPAPRPVARAAASRTPAPATRGSGGGRAVGWGAVVVAGFAIRVCAGFGSHSSHDAAPPPQFNVPQVDQKVFDDGERWRQINRDFEEQQRQQKVRENLDRIIREADQEHQKGKRPGDRPWWVDDDPDPFGPREHAPTPPPSTGPRREP